jgi:hypothetical protein
VPADGILDIGLAFQFSGFSSRSSSLENHRPRPVGRQRRNPKSCVGPAPAATHTQSRPIDTELRVGSSGSISCGDGCRGRDVPGQQSAVPLQGALWFALPPWSVKRQAASIGEMPVGGKQVPFAGVLKTVVRKRSGPTPSLGPAHCCYRCHHYSHDELWAGRRPCFLGRVRGD